jgi:hypothetical protein
MVILSPAWASPTPDAKWIVTQVFKRDKELQERRKAFDYNLDTIRQKLDSHQVVIETEEQKSVVLGDHRPEYWSKKDEKGIEPEGKKQPDEAFNLLKVLDHFDYAMEGTEKINQVDCYKIRFTPKPDMPYHSREEKVTNAIAGHLWASVQDYSLVQNEGTLTHPVAVGWIFATLREMEFRYESQTLPNGDPGPKRVSYRYLVNIPFGQIHERRIRTMSDYHTSAER